MDLGNTSAGPSFDDYYDDWDKKPDLFGVEDDSEDSADEKIVSKKKKKKSVKGRSYERGITYERMVVPEDMMIAPQIPIVGGAPLVGTECHVMVDGYFRKGRGGGFGAVVVRPSGLPVAALAGVAETPVSGLYHVFQGMLEGLFLAHKRKMEYVILSCNSDRACWMVESCDCFYGQKGCHKHPGGEFDTFCIPCLKNYVGVRDEGFAPYITIMREIILFSRNKFNCFTVLPGNRYFNQGADFLAKYLKGPVPVKIIWDEPRDFPLELQEILKDTSSGFPYAEPALPKIM